VKGLDHPRRGPRGTAFLALFLVLPLGFVFTQALAKGTGFYFATLNHPMTWSAIRLTLLTAGIAVPFFLCAGRP